MEYFVVEGDKKFPNETDADGFDTFAIAYHHQGHVTVKRTLDYERVHRYFLTIVASVRILNFPNLKK